MTLDGLVSERYVLRSQLNFYFLSKDRKILYLGLEYHEISAEKLFQRKGDDYLSRFPLLKCTEFIIGYIPCMVACHRSIGGFLQWQCKESTLVTRRNLQANVKPMTE